MIAIVPTIFPIIRHSITPTEHLVAITISTTLIGTVQNRIANMIDIEAWRLQKSVLMTKLRRMRLIPNIYHSLEEPVTIHSEEAKISILWKRVSSKQLVGTTSTNDWSKSEVYKLMQQESLFSNVYSYFFMARSREILSPSPLVPRTIVHSPIGSDGNFLNWNEFFVHFFKQAFHLSLVKSASNRLSKWPFEEQSPNAVLETFI